jgi:phosphoribosylformylglycinamidine synthase
MTGLLRVKERGAVVAEIPNRALTDEAPVYRRPMTEPEYLREVQQLDPDALQPSEQNASLLALLGSPTVASKRWVYRQYDHMVRDQHHQPARFRGRRCPDQGLRTARWRCRSTGNGRYCYLDPYRGAMLAVPKRRATSRAPARRPLAATNCLNFGNPERPAIMWQFAEAVEGIGAACRALDCPDHRRQRQPLQRDRRQRHLSDADHRRRRPASSTPDRVVGRRFQESGDAIILLGRSRGELGGSEYLKVVHDLVRGVPPALDLAASARCSAARRARRPAPDCGPRTTARTAASR